MQSIEEMIRESPPDLQREVTDFAQFLLEKRLRKAGKKLSQDWEGELKDYHNRYTSLELLTPSIFSDQDHERYDGMRLVQGSITTGTEPDTSDQI